jgi:hypothetical protein
MEPGAELGEASRRRIPAKHFKIFYYLIFFNLNK